MFLTKRRNKQRTRRYAPATKKAHVVFKYFVLLIPVTYALSELVHFLFNWILSLHSEWLALAVLAVIYVLFFFLFLMYRYLLIMSTALYKFGELMYIMWQEYLPHEHWYTYIGMVVASMLGILMLHKLIVFWISSACIPRASWILRLQKKYRVLVYTVSAVTVLYIINTLCLFRPLYTTIADPYIIVVRPLLMLNDGFKKFEQRVVTRGQDYYPLWLRNPYYKPGWIPEPYSKTDFTRNTFRDVARYDHWLTPKGMPEWVMPAVVVAESKGRFAQLPESENNGKGGAELGITQPQAILCAEFLPTAGARESFMDKKNGVYNTRLDYQRSRLLAFLYGIELPKYLGWVDMLRHYVTTSIDARLSTRIFDFTISQLKKNYRYAKKRKPEASNETLWQCAIAIWHAGPGGGMNIWNSKKISQDYVEAGKGYVAWKKQVKKEVSLTLNKK